jgi:hypothetical protein
MEPEFPYRVRKIHLVVTTLSQVYTFHTFTVIFLYDPL